MIKSLIPDEAKVNITIDDIRLKLKLNITNTIRYRICFLWTTLSFTQSLSGSRGDIESFVQLIPGEHKSEKPNNLTGFEKILLKCDCNKGSLANVSANQFCTTLVLLHLQLIKYLKNLESNFLKRQTNLFCLI